MFCQHCGNQIADGAKFCPNCGKEIISSIIETISPKSVEAEPTRQNSKLGDDVIDAISSKLSGKKIETIRISMEDMIILLKKNFIESATTSKELKEIQKAINGAVIGLSTMDSKDGNYSLAVSIVMQIAGRFDLLHPGDSNWIRVLDKTTGKVYQYSSFTWGKFKKAVKSEIDSFKKQSGIK